MTNLKNIKDEVSFYIKEQEELTKGSYVCECGERKGKNSRTCFNCYRQSNNGYASNGKKRTKVFGEAFAKFVLEHKNEYTTHELAEIFAMNLSNTHGYISRKGLADHVIGCGMKDKRSSPESKEKQRKSIEKQRKTWIKRHAMSKEDRVDWNNFLQENKKGLLQRIINRII